MDPAHLAEWIEDAHGEGGLWVPPASAPMRSTSSARARATSCKIYALRTYDVTAAAGVARPADADVAFRELVDDRDDLARTFWGGLTAQQQNVLRAVAVQPAGLTTADVLERSWASRRVAP